MNKIQLNYVGNPEDETRNAEGYIDPTYTTAITRLEEEERFHDFLGSLFKICKKHGFYMNNRIHVTDLRTGREWK